MKIYISILIFVFLTVQLPAQPPQKMMMGKFYNDGHGGQVYFPLADVSFADEVVSFKKGSPAAAKIYSQPDQALGIPDFDQEKDKNYVTLGCGGVLTLRFVDNVLIDNEGPDLYVFEIGPAIEPTKLSISKDGGNWIEIGKISGGKAEVDLSGYVKPRDIFYYIRLEDLRTDCDGRWPGADIDAVGAIGSALRISVKSSILFAFDRWELSPTADKELDKVLLKIKNFSQALIHIDGHTDSLGSDDYNQALSLKRAASVAGYLQKKEELKNFQIEANGYGERRPIASNETEEGRQANRRVEIIVFPKETSATSQGLTQEGKEILNVAGRWNTNWGELVLKQLGNQIEGVYSEDNGEIFGSLRGNIFEGYWIEDNSAQRCSQPLRGRYYWGRVRITFGLDSFKAKWGYCNAEPTKEGWEGKRMR